MTLLQQYRKGNIKAQLIPVLVWLFALGFLIILLTQQTKTFEATGIVYGEERRIAATVAGRIKNIRYTLYQKVQQGEVVVVVDTILNHQKRERDLVAKKEIINAKIGQLRAELDALSNEMLTEAKEKQQDLTNEQRRYYLDVEDAKLKLVELKSLIEPAKVKIKELDLNLKLKELEYQTPNLLAQDQVRIGLEIEKIKAEIQTIESEIKENQILLVQSQDNLSLAQNRLDTFKLTQPIIPAIEIALKPIQEEIVVQEKTIDELVLKYTLPEMEITAPFNGVVSEVRRREGEAILERDLILTVVEDVPDHIRAYVSEEMIGQIRENMEIEILKSSYPQKVAKTKIKNLGPVMELMPERLWANAQLPRWGRPVLIEIPPNMGDLLPGEMVSIRGLK